VSVAGRAAPPVLWAHPELVRQRLGDLLGLLKRDPARAKAAVATAQDVIDLLSDQIEAVRLENTAGTLERARTIGFLAGIASRRSRREI